MSGYSKKSAALREVDPAHALAEIRREKAERNLSDFIRQAWPIIEPGTEYVHNWHIDLISEYMEAVNLGQINRLVINMPPRHMKSIHVHTG